MASRKPAVLDQPGPDLAALAHLDPEAVRAQLDRLSPPQIADRILGLDPELREQLLSLVGNPEEVVPLLAEIEFASTLRASGVAEGAWLLEFSTPEQRVACIDLDCWQDVELSITRMRDWLDALIAAGSSTLTAAFDDLDPELWVLILRDMADFWVLGRDDDPPPAALSEDGVVYYLPRHEEDDRRLIELLRIAFSEAPARYWQLVYGVVFESQAECEEYALRWHRGRLNDLGFPDREHAMRAYRPLALDDAAVVDLGARANPNAITTAPRLPEVLSGTLLARAFGELPAARAADLLGYVLAVGNTIAIADRMPLSETQSIDRALRKAVRGIDRGLEALARSRAESPGHVLDQTRPLDLFRIGATLDPSLRPARAIPDL